VFAGRVGAHVGVTRMSDREGRSVRCSLPGGDASTASLGSRHARSTCLSLLRTPEPLFPVARQVCALWRTGVGVPLGAELLGRHDLTCSGSCFLGFRHARTLRPRGSAVVLGRLALRPGCLLTVCGNRRNENGGSGLGVPASGRIALVASRPFSRKTTVVVPIECGVARSRLSPRVQTTHVDA